MGQRTGWWGGKTGKEVVVVALLSGKTEGGGKGGRPNLKKN